MIAQKLFKQSQDLINQFVLEGWPETILITGAQTSWKKNFIISAIVNSLWHARRSENYSLDTIQLMVNKNEHPDFYYFGSERIKIGDKKNPEPGSVRHMIDHFLAFAPRMSRERFVFFEDAALILSEAESSLLKSLEESPVGTHFILSIDEASGLKDTIISRCIEISLNRIPDLSLTPNDPWERFWFFSEWTETQLYENLIKKEWPQFLRESYDNLGFNAADYLIFEDIGWNGWKKKFQGENADTQSTVMKISFYPLYCAIRDRMVNGRALEIAPISLPIFSERKLILLTQTMDLFFRRLGVRYFNTRVPALNVIFFSFLSRFMRIWTADI